MVWQAWKVTWLVSLYCQWELNALDVSSNPSHKNIKDWGRGNLIPVCRKLFADRCIIMYFNPCLVWGTYSCILYTHYRYALYMEKSYSMYYFYCNFLRDSKSLAGGCVQCYLSRSDWHSTNLNTSDWHSTDLNTSDWHSTNWIHLTDTLLTWIHLTDTLLTEYIWLTLY